MDDEEMLKAIGDVTVTGAQIEASLLRVLAVLVGMPLGTVIAFVGRMHAEPLIDTIQRMTEYYGLPKIAGFNEVWKPLKKDLGAFFGFRGQVAHTAWVEVADPDGPVDAPGVLRPWRRELDIYSLPMLTAEDIAGWAERGRDLLVRLQEFSDGVYLNRKKPEPPAA